MKQDESPNSRTAAVWGVWDQSYKGCVWSEIITKKCLKAHLLIQMGRKIKTPAALYESDCQVKVIGKISADIYF